MQTKSIVRLKKRDHFGGVTENDHLILQRRGCSETLEAGGPDGLWFEIQRQAMGARHYFLKVTKSTPIDATRQIDRYQATNLQTVFDYIESKYDLKVAADVAAYMFGTSFNVGRDYQEDDLILNGAYYSESTDTIRTPENHCLVSFDGFMNDPIERGCFADFVLTVDAATKDYRSAAREVLTNRRYFHTEMRNDRFGNKPVEYLKRRAAWLIGQELLRRRLIGVWCDVETMERV